MSRYSCSVVPGFLLRKHAEVGERQKAQNGMGNGGEPRLLRSERVTRGKRQPWGVEFSRRGMPGQRQSGMKIKTGVLGARTIELSKPRN